MKATNLLIATTSLAASVAQALPTPMNTPVRSIAATIHSPEVRSGVVPRQTSTTAGTQNNGPELLELLPPPRRRAPFWQAEARLFPLDKIKTLSEDTVVPAAEANAAYGLEHALWFHR